MSTPTKEQLLELVSDIGAERVDLSFWDNIDNHNLSRARYYLLGLLDGLCQVEPAEFTEGQFHDFYDRLGFSPEEHRKLRQSKTN